MPPYPAIYQDHTQTTISHIVSLLAAKNIPCLLWGEHLLRTYACTLQAPDYKFLVEDDQLDHAYRTLLDAGFIRCPDRERQDTATGSGTFDICPVYRDTCNYRSSRNRKRTTPSYTHPPPKRHVHFSPADSHSHPDPVSLFPKSLFLSFTPRLPAPNPQSQSQPQSQPQSQAQAPRTHRTKPEVKACYIPADTLGPLPTPSHGGRFTFSDSDSHSHKVLMPAPLILVEALIYLALGKGPGTRSIWTVWLGSLREAYVDHGVGEAAWDVTRLHPRLRAIWGRAGDVELDAEGVLWDYWELGRVLREGLSESFNGRGIRGEMLWEGSWRDLEGVERRDRPFGFLGREFM
ncbi:hypothetical protein BJX61DRAFT_151467 [Aspergillus egyptiacus]|nr:hypothetical protein BJX61DRAFT_151467 [Aspergillus egyptiacus]